VSFKVADGWEELKGAEFDVIHVGAAAKSIPDALVKALKPGGRMLCPVGEQGKDQYLTEIAKTKDGKVSSRKLLGVQYVPLVSTKKPNLAD